MISKSQRGRMTRGRSTGRNSSRGGLHHWTSENPDNPAGAVRDEVCFAQDVEAGTRASPDPPGRSCAPFASLSGASPPHTLPPTQSGGYCRSLAGPTRPTLPPVRKGDFLFIAVLANDRPYPNSLRLGLTYHIWYSHYMACGGLTSTGASTSNLQVRNLRRSLSDTRSGRTLP